MNLRNCYTADFETTTDENDLRVWAYSICNIEDTNDFIYGTNIEDFITWCADPKINYKVWFHNLKFDASYILSYLLENGYEYIDDKKDKKDKSFTCLISDMGQYYSISIYFKVKNHHTNKVEILDSLKIFPNFSVERVAEGFNLPIRKLEIDYHKYRPVGYELDTQEIDYIRNDVEIMALALKEMFTRGLTKMTIASDAMNNFKENFSGFRKKFPLLPAEVDKDIRKSYRGGFTYVNEIYREKKVGKGIVLDINSLYPSCLCSPHLLPVGQPKLFEGKYKDDPNYPLYVQSITCSFDLKSGKIPSVQIKNSFFFAANEYVKSSNGEEITLYLTKPDYELFISQYNIHNPTYNGGWKFMGTTGLFDNYINYWMSQKIKAAKEGNAPLRAISKLLANSLYGKFGVSSNSRRKIPVLDHDGILQFVNIEDEPRETIYVPVAAFVTALGRKRIILASQAVRDYTLDKYGEDRYFYSDTDSLHANLSEEDLEELKDVLQIDDYKMGFFKKEGEFDRAIFIRQKCYVEELNGKLDVTVAGLPKYLAPLVTFDNFKRGFTTENMTLNEMVEQAKANGASDEEIKKLHHKLSYKYVKGGVILADTGFTIK